MSRQRWGSRAQPPRSGSTATVDSANSANQARARPRNATAAAAQPQVVRGANLLRTRARRRPGESPHGEQDPGRSAIEQTQVHRPHWRNEPGAPADRREAAGPHGPHRREEGRPDPGRWRLAGPRQEQPGGPRGRSCEDARNQNGVTTGSLPRSSSTPAGGPRRTSVAKPSTPGTCTTTTTGRTVQRTAIRLRPWLQSASTTSWPHTASRLLPERRRRPERRACGSAGPLATPPTHPRPVRGVRACRGSASPGSPGSGRRRCRSSRC